MLLKLPVSFRSPQTPRRSRLDSWLQVLQCPLNREFFAFRVLHRQPLRQCHHPSSPQPAGTKPGMKSWPLPRFRNPSAFCVCPPRGQPYPSPPQVLARHQRRPGMTPATWSSRCLTPGRWGENSTGGNATEQESQTGVKNQEEIQCHEEQTKRENFVVRLQ